MPTNSTTFGTLLTQVRQRADMEGSTFVSDVEIRVWLNAALAELHDIMVLVFEDYYVNSATYTLPGADANMVLTGTIDPPPPEQIAADTIVGVGTDFLNELSAGDRILVSGETRTVVRVLDSLRLVVDGYFNGSVLDTSPEKVDGIPFGTLPADFYKVVGVDFSTGGSTHTVKPYSFRERNAYNEKAGLLGGRGSELRYNIQDDRIKFIPESSPAGTVTLHYVPECQQFRTGGEDDGVRLETKNKSIATGTQEYLVVSAAIKCLMKEESDVRMLLAEKADLQRRIEAAAPRKDAGHPHKIIDVNGGTRINLLH